MIRTLAALLALVPALALAGERTLVVKTFEDDRYPPDRPVCTSLYGEGANVFLGASAWSLQTNAARGEVMNDEVKFLGPVLGCGAAPTLGGPTPPPPFTPGQLFYMRFQLADGTYTFQGQCDVVSWKVPLPGVLLVGCALALKDAPQGVAGGFATSSSVFNPYGVGGYPTGSVWTLHLYTND
jgi:hypothetical protein